MTLALAFLGRHWKLALTGFIVFSLSITATYYRLDRNHWRSVAGVLRLDLDAIKDAQATATALAEAKKREEQATFNQLAERADNATRQITGMRAAAGRYASTHRVRGKAPGGASGGTGGASAGEAATGGDGPGSDASVALSRADFDQLVGNTIRLKQVHDFGNDLIAAGLAEK